MAQSIYLAPYALGLVAGSSYLTAFRRSAELSTASWRLYAACLATAFSFYRLIFAPNFETSKNYHDSRSAGYRAMRSKCFFPGFANGWHAVCNAEDLRNGQVKSISALGTHMVAFRGEDGKVGVLHAFCPHLGAHLGQGGVVEGNLLVCPFHKWAFNAAGKCEQVPYMRTDLKVPDRARTKAYEVREILGIILVWFHAEEEFASAPLWEPRMSDDLIKGIADGSWYYALMRTVEFEQHSCEMAMNSADPFHFDTLHGPFPIPVLEKFIKGVHKIKAWYNEGIDSKGNLFRQNEYSYITENTDGLYFFGNRSFPVPFSEMAAQSVHTTVTFEGPTIIHFVIHTPIGRMRQLITLTPIEPFKQYVESRWYAERSVPRFVVSLFAYIASKALEQDRQVWENKIFRKKPLLVSGDGPFPVFIRWYGQFYSEGSRALEDPANLDW